jgi:anti-sigma factor RsiW
MLQHSDEALVAYLDGELDSADLEHVEAWLDADPAARERLAALAQSATLLRSAFADIVNEPVPEHLVAAARGDTVTANAAASDKIPAIEIPVIEAPHEAKIVAFRQPEPRAAATGPARRWYVGMAAAAGLFGVLFGGAGTYFGLGLLGPANTGGEQKVASLAADNIWLNNAAGYYKLLASAGDGMPLDVPANNDPQAAWQKISQNLPQQAHLPDLKPWGLNFRGARLIVVDGRPAAQLVYATDNKAIGPLSLIIGPSKQGDAAPTFDRRQDVNMLHWRHQGRAYALVGQTDIGYLWGIANDVAYQLAAI